MVASVSTPGGFRSADHHGRSGNRHCSLPRFLEEREAVGAKGRSWLFFGNQYFNLDFLYRSELDGFLDRGALTRLDIAFSRDSAEKVYVQDRMLERRPNSGNGSKRARTSTSVATPSGWPAMSIKCSAGSSPSKTADRPKKRKTTSLT